MIGRMMMMRAGTIIKSSGRLARSGLLLPNRATEGCSRLGRSNGAIGGSPSALQFRDDMRGTTLPSKDNVFLIRSFYGFSGGRNATSSDEDATTESDSESVYEFNRRLTPFSARTDDTCAILFKHRLENILGINTVTVNIFLKWYGRIGLATSRDLDDGKRAIGNGPGMSLLALITKGRLGLNEATHVLIINCFLDDASSLHDATSDEAAYRYARKWISSLFNWSDLRGYPIKDGAMLAVLRFNRMKEPGKLSDVLTELSEKGRLSIEVYNYFLDCVVSTQGVDKARCFTFFMSSDFNLDHNEVTYKTLLNACLHSDNTTSKYATAISLMYDMSEGRGIAPTAGCFNYILRFAVSENKPDQFWNVVNAMERLAVEQDDDTCHIIMDFCVKELIVCEDAFSRIKQKTTRSYNILLRSHFIALQAYEALSLFEEMKSENVRADNYTYGTMVHGLIECGEVDKALQLFSTVPSPDLATCTTVIKFYFSSGEPRKALEVFRAVKKRPDKHMLEVMAGGVCRVPGMGKVCAEMKKRLRQFD